MTGTKIILFMNPTKLLLLLSVIIFSSCSHKPDNCVGPCGKNMNRIETPETPEEAMIMKAVADTSTTGNAEFKENKKKIEAEYGEQWDFCKCVVLNDSLDKAAKSGEMDDNFMKRFDEVDTHCKAFLVMDNTRTPEERAKHEKKIAKCLKNAGVR